MKIMVTGGSGFIGSNFIRGHVRAFPDEIFNIDNLSIGSNEKNLDGVKNVTSIKIDIRSRIFKDVFDFIKPDVIVHFAAETHVDRSIGGPLQFVDTNVFGTFNILETLRLHDEDRKTLLMHVSTDEVYGSLALDAPQLEYWTEESPYQPNSPYSASKASSDFLVRSYWKTYGVKSIITNCSNNYGPRQNVEKFIPKIITNLIKGEKVPVYGNGDNIRDWIWVADHCWALQCLIGFGKIGEKYNIGGSYNEISNLEVVKKIIRIMGKDESSIEFVQDRPGHDKKYMMDFTKMATVGKWLPSVDFDKGLEYTIRWYSENRDWWA